jgi:hypothetical protein
METSVLESGVFLFMRRGETPSAAVESAKGRGGFFEVPDIPRAEKIIGLGRCKLPAVAKDARGVS